MNDRAKVSKNNQIHTQDSCLIDAELIAFYHEHGFCIVKGVLTQAECSSYLREADAFAESQKNKYANAMNPDRTNPAFAKLMRHKLIIAYLEAIQQTKISALQSMLFYRPPGSAGRDLHQDNFYGQSEYGAYIGAWIPLEDTDRENGGLVAYPGSHREPLLPVIEDEERRKTNVGDFKNDRGLACMVPKGYEKVYLKNPAGSVMFIHGHIVHGSEDNLSKTRFRRVFTAHYIKKGFSFIPGAHAKRREMDVYSVDFTA